MKGAERPLQNGRARVSLAPPEQGLGSRNNQPTQPKTHLGASYLPRRRVVSRPRQLFPRPSQSLGHVSTLPVGLQPHPPQLRPGPELRVERDPKPSTPGPRAPRTPPRDSLYHSLHNSPQHLFQKQLLSLQFGAASTCPSSLQEHKLHVIVIFFSWWSRKPV